MEQKITDGSRQDLGRANRRRVLGELVFRGPLSRTAIAKNTGLTAASVSRITRDLIGAGLVAERASVVNPNRPGRRFVELDIDGSGGFVLGIGLNVFQQSVTLADLKNRRIDRIDLNLADLSDPDQVIAAVVEAARHMIDTHVRNPDRLFGGSVAMTGAVDPVSGIVKDSPYLGWTDVDMAAQLEDALGISFQIENLPNAINFAEVRFGKTRERMNTLLFNCALGCGASMYLDGRLVRGHDFMGGLIGALPPGTEQANGRSLDDLAAGRGVLLATGMSAAEIDDLPADALAESLMSIVRAANAGDAKYIRIAEESGAVLGQAIALFAGMVRPEVIMLSGPMSECHAYVAACEAAFRKAGGTVFETVPVVTTDTSAQAAARLLAIGEFMVKRDLELSHLEIEEAA